MTKRAGTVLVEAVVVGLALSLMLWAATCKSDVAAWAFACGAAFHIGCEVIGGTLSTTLIKPTVHLASHPGPFRESRSVSTYPNHNADLPRYAYLAESKRRGHRT